MVKLDLSTPVAATKTFFLAAKAHDAATAEKALSPRFLAGLARSAEKETVAGILKEMADDAGYMISVAEEPLELTETKAKVAVTMKHPTKGLDAGQVDLVKVGDQWLVDDL